MSKIDAPDIEPSPVEEKKPAPRPRGRYIDFAPRRKVKKAPEPAPKVTVVVTPKIEDTPVEELTVGDIIADTPVVRKTTIITEEPEENFDEVEEYDDGPMAEFNNFDDDFAEEAQEDFLSSDTDDNYVEEVLSKVSETRTEETTVRRSPFLKNYHVEKRPLSTRIPVRKNVPSVEALEPTPRKEFEEEEFIRRADPVPEDVEAPTETKEEKTASKLGMAITIIVTVLLGAGVGVFVYLAFFK